MSSLVAPDSKVIAAINKDSEADLFVAVPQVVKAL